MHKRFFIGFLLPFLVTGMCMWAIDPFHMFSNINTARKPFNPRERASLALEAVRMQPEAAFVGSSRTRRLDPSHPGWNGMQVLNGGLSGARMYEVANYFEHIQSVRPLRTALIEVFFRPSIKEARPLGGADRERLLREGDDGVLTRMRYAMRRMIDRYEGLYSIRELALMLRFNGHILPLPETVGALYEGFPAAPEIPADDPSRYEWIPAPTVESIRRIITLAEKHGTDVTFFIAPEHAEHLNKVIVNGDWDGYEKQLRALTEYLDGGNEFGRSYPLWNFQRYNDITQVSPPPEKFTDSEWYDNLRHFSPKTGTMILDTILGACSEPCMIPPADFSVVLTRDSIDAHIAHLRAHRPSSQTDGGQQ